MKVILNPSAGKGAAGRIVPELRRLRDREFPGAELILTERAGQAHELARTSAAEGEELVVAVGGDGTVSEVAGGLAGTDTALGIVAIGTGNDAARSLGLPVNRPLEAMRLIARGGRRRIDLGRSGRRHFISILGIGFPAIVAGEANRQRRFGGRLAFSLAVYRRIGEMRPAQGRFILDGEAFDLECTSILVQNTPFTGGGLRVAPRAEVDDGFLDVVVVDNIGKIDLLWNFPRLFKGTHVSNPHFHLFRCREFAVQTSPGLPMTIDGDPYGVSPAEARVVPAALSVVVEKREEVRRES